MTWRGVRLCRSCILLCLLSLVLQEARSEDDIIGDLKKNAVPSKEWQPGEVAVLSAENMTLFVRDHPKVLVEFYAPWCGHCKSLEPEFNNAAKSLAEEGLESVLGKVDATIEKSLAAKFDVKGYPTLRYFADEGPKKIDNSVEYTGGRTADDIHSWLKKRETSPIEIFKSKAEAVDFVTQAQRGGILVFIAKDDSEKSKKLKLAKKAAKSYILDNDERVGVIEDHDAESSIIYVKSPSAITHEEDEKEVKYTGKKWLSKKVEQFVADARYPFIADSPSQELHLESNLKKSTVLIAITSDISKNATIDMFAPIIMKWKDQDVVFTFSDPSAEGLGFKSEVEDVQVLILDRRDNTKGSTPSEPGSAKKYYTSGPWKEGELEKFFDDWQSGKLSTYKKSAPIPPNDGKDPSNGVWTIVGDTWEKIVKDPRKDVFIEYYAPWCGHCKELAPKWEKLAKKVHPKMKDVIIAKMDATENDVEGVTGFPTIHFYPANKEKKVIKYGGSRELDDLFDFVENTAESLDEDRDEL